jgi:acyl carrier protein
VAGHGISVADLRARLRTALPDYMMPAHFVLLDAFPLNANGKLNRHALPSPDLKESAHSYVAPRDELEQGVAELWAEVLGVPRIGIEDNFFDHGGHSLLAAQAMARVRQRYGIALGVADFFEAQTVALFAARLGAARREAELLARLGAQPADDTEEMESFTL